ncbi:PQQ-dependent sugar dehydrogenase [Hymenobacter sp. BT186]|uniref:PQQ-dependent sugar dehydrogenase n=1 Tax=Hymenobacter telluris TaxID=2816474 RepID=A0A939ET97_9BACT|nr:PQQ-dependent sugar dehydrogenase [Hymenobacter telluris]MBO0357048.1 PQQ-dependent sugar dehydrogenase [Hymenobacter telluris]MBW3373075.1 PQQ-dependent sugar dehydrogenase [Hymenobacter norwichensis]
MKRFSTLLLFGALAAPAMAQQGPVLATYTVGSTTLSASALTNNLDTPWELLWGPDNFIWMTERMGRISRVNPTTGQVLPLLTIADVTETGESGLLGMALHPNFTATPYVYVVYNYTDSGALKEKLVRYTYSATTNTLSSPLVLLGNITAVTTHSGSRLFIQPDLTLLMTTGDAQQRPEAQNVASLNGKVLRLNLDGTVPANNPIPGSLVYSFGHRNPQGLTRTASGQIYSSEHGENIEDEVNLIEVNRNYGWPTVEGFCNTAAEQTFCTANNVREPLASYTPTRAVAGLTTYTHPAIPEWNNSLLLVTLKDGFTQLQLNLAGTQITAQNTLWTTTYGRLRSICVSPQGRIYIGTSNRDGRGNPAATDDRILVLENRAYVPSAVKQGQASALQLWPNPATQTVAVRLSAAPRATTTVQLRDALGRTARTLQLPSGQQETRLDLAGLRSGLYMVQAQLGDVQYTRRLVVE